MKELIRKKGSLLIAALGLWLFVAPITFGYKLSSICTNDHVCGLLLILLGFLSIKTGRKCFIGVSAFVGLWLQLAPLFFWAPESASYLNDTLVGMVLMIVSFSLPGMVDEESIEEVPFGWSFNPSAWGPRGVTVFLALICWFLARYLASYQLGYIQEIKDPFFGDGSMKVISSSVAKMFPVSDAGLGAFGYSLEFLLGLVGGSRRWKTMPWIAICFGGMVVPAGMISILLIVLQPVLVGAWCGLCLIIAICMLVMILLTIPEVVAAIQLLRQTRKMKKSVWNVFWRGDSTSSSLAVSPFQRTKTSVLGFTIPWNLVLTLVLGVWLMSSPSILGLEHPAADSNYIAGPLLFAISVISFSEILRFLRFANLILGIGLIASVFLLEGFSTYGWLNNVGVGILVSFLSFPRGIKREAYGEDV